MVAMFDHCPMINYLKELKTLNLIKNISLMTYNRKLFELALGSIREREDVIAIIDQNSDFGLGMLLCLQFKY